MRTRFTVVIIVVGLVLGMAGAAYAYTRTRQPGSFTSPDTRIVLPAPRYDSDISLEQALLRRRSIREYRDEPLTMAEIAQLLWSAQGITDSRGYRTAPSAGALYPLEIYLVAGDVSDLPQGVYRYVPQEHVLLRVASGDRRDALCEAALQQQAVQDAAAVLVIAAVFERTTVKYGQRGFQYVHMEVGSASQNVYLQAVSLNLGTVFIGAFHDQEVQRALGLAGEEQPLGLMPIGKK